MRTTGLGESAFRRVIVIAGATAAVMISIVLFVKPIDSSTTNPKAASSADVSGRVANQQPEIETVSFVTSPTIDPNPQFFFGTGDGSNGYYAERPQQP